MNRIRGRLHFNSNYLFLLILPILLFITAHILKNAQGPYYLNFYDPSYVYLINSLNLAQLNGYGVSHFDHPGTPVQVIGAILITVYHSINSENIDLVSDVLLRPEVYLQMINRILVILNCTGLFLLGFLTYKNSKNIYLSLLIQLSPFVSTEIFYGLIIVTAENFLIFVSLCFIGVLVYYLFKIDTDRKTPLSFVIALSIVCGLGLATKLSFLPLLLIPFLLIKEIKNRLIFFSITILSFLIFVFPALSNYAEFISWVEKLFMHSGQYGLGDSTIINSTTFFNNISKIFITDNIFAISYLMVLIALGAGIFAKSRTGLKRICIDKKIRLLFGIFLAFTLQVILVAKHYAQYYMIPSFMLSIFALIVAISIIYVILEKYGFIPELNYIFICITILISLTSLLYIVVSYSEGNMQRSEAFKIENYIRVNYSGDLVISTFGSANPDCALAFASLYGGSQYERYRNLLSGKPHSSYIFYNPWGNQLYTISDKTNTKEEILKRKTIILQISYWEPLNEFIDTLKKASGLENLTYEQVYINGNKESLYEVKLNN